MKENLYCVPYDKKIKTRQNGVVYHCEKTVDEKNVPDKKTVKCNVCNKEFKDERCLKIHQTKMKHHKKEVPSKKRTKTSSSPVELDVLIKKSKMFFSK